MDGYRVIRMGTYVTVEQLEELRQPYPVMILGEVQQPDGSQALILSESRQEKAHRLAIESGLPRLEEGLYGCDLINGEFIKLEHNTNEKI